MSLLDMFGNSDDPQQQGMLSAAAQMLAASGPSLMPHSFGQVMGAGLQGYQQGRQQAMQMQKEQMAARLQALQYDQAKREGDLLNGIVQQLLPGGQGPAAQAQQQGAPQAAAPAMPASLPMGSADQDGRTISTPGFFAPADFAPQPGAGGAPASAGPGAAAGSPAAVSPRLMMALALKDHKFNDAYGILKDMQTGYERKPGSFYINPETGGQTYMPDPTKGFAFDPTTQTVSALPGFSDTNAGIEGAKTDAVQRATNSNTLAPLDRINPATGRPYNMTTQQLIDSMSQPTSSSLFSQLPGATQAALRSQNPSGGAAFDFGAPDGTRLQGTVPSSFQGFAGPADQLLAAAKVKQQTDPNTAYQTASAQNMAEYEKNLNDRVASGQDLMSRIAESRAALAQFQAGGGADTRVKAAQLAQSAGAPQSLVDAISGGNLGAAQEFQKLAAQQAMESLKQSIGSGRVAQAEFKVFQDNNPKLDTDPRAIEKVYNFATQVYQRDKAQQDALTAYKQVPGADITAFPNYWASHSGVPVQQVTGGAKGTQPAAAPAPAAPAGQGGQQQYSVIAPNGKRYTFSDASALANFKFRMGIQ